MVGTRHHSSFWCKRTEVGGTCQWGARGQNSNGELGDGTTTERDSPVAVDTTGALAGVTLTQISAGVVHTCALSTQGDVYCWGYNFDGRVGDGSTTERHTPVAVDTSGVLSGVTVAHVSAGGAHTCALSAAGQGYCWGQNSSGELGDGTTTERDSPVAVDTTGALAGVALTQISAEGALHTCALSA
jgi:alpha-tubulin suppressor-like RCC1 family protein